MADILPLGARPTCKNCLEEIFSAWTVGVRCEECADLDLCPECFSLGVQIGSHVSGHAYRVLDNANFPVLDSGWSGRDLLRLLDAVEQFGFGNWQDVAKQINSGSLSETVRTAEEVKNEYCSKFIHGIIGRRSWREDQRSRARDHTQGNPLLPPAPPAQPPPNLTLNESIMLGYMPKRDDFEIEFDNEAERLVSQIHGGLAVNEDEDMDVALKASLVDMYRHKLQERERRKRVAREHQLITQYFRENPLASGERRSILNNSKKKDLNERLKIFAEFQGVQEHQSFAANVAKEKRLKSRIKDLIRFRKNGVRHLKDSQEYERQRLGRSHKKKLEAALNGKADPVHVHMDAGATLGLSGASPLSIKSEDGSPWNTSLLSPHKDSADSKFHAIAHLPGFEVLSTNEKKLCVGLKLTPGHYISYKTCLLTNHLQKKKGQTPKPLNPEGLDKNNRKIIFQFLMRSGWITAY